MIALELPILLGSAATSAATESSPTHVIVLAAVAGILASIACGLGALPLAFPTIDPAKHRGLGYAVASGLMVAASCFNLVLPGIEMGEPRWALQSQWMVIFGILLGAAFLSIVYSKLPDVHDGEENSKWGGRIGIMVFIAMTLHSLPEGVAVGVGYTSDAVGMHEGSAHLGPTLALAIAIHNIPEGLAVAIPLRSAGMSIWRCFIAAFLTSLPQPIAAVPAVLFSWFFQPLMPGMMGFAAGAMIFLVVIELVPEALKIEKASRVAWAFTIGFCGMMLLQALL